MFGESEDRITFESEPSGATVYLNGKKLGTTPLTVNVKRESNAVWMAFKKSGYETEEFQLERGVAKAALWNLGFISTTFGATSWGIDAMSGKLFEYNPTEYVVELTSKETEASDRQGALKFVLINYNAIQEDVARGEGPHLDVLRSKWNLCTRTDGLLLASDGLDLYRRCALQ